MRIITVTTVIACFLLAGAALAGEGAIKYRASVVHNNRSYMSIVNGIVDLESGDFREEIEKSFFLNWKQVPAGFSPIGAALPLVVRVDGKIAHHFKSGLPSFDSPLLRHFVISEIISGAGRIAKGGLFLEGQLEIIEVQEDQAGFEYICSFLGSPLVIVGKRAQDAGRWLIQDIAVLGATEEMYQYIMDEIVWTSGPPAVSPKLPIFEPSDYVTFPKNGSQPVPIRPIKDWLVFQGSLPNGRPLNLVLDSGSETTIIDDMVLELDARLEPEGEMLVAGAFQTETMELYTGFNFNVGGVEFSNLPVAGTALTSLAYGAGLRIHGIVGSDVLRLCRLDIDLVNGTLTLSPPNSSAKQEGVKLPLTFIHDLPHIPADVLGMSGSLLLLDTGQRSSLQVNIDLLEANQLDDELIMNGFLSGIAGGLQPRYMLENLTVEIAGQSFEEKAVDALMANSYNFRGQKVVGTVGFTMLSGHYSGVSINYQNKQIFLQGGQVRREFVGKPEAWDTPSAPLGSYFALGSDEAGGQAELPQSVWPKEVSSSKRPARLGESPPTQFDQLGPDYEAMLKELSEATLGDRRASAPGLAVMLEKSGGNPGESMHIASLLRQAGLAGEVGRAALESGETPGTRSGMQNLRQLDGGIGNPDAHYPGLGSLTRLASRLAYIAHLNAQATWRKARLDLGSLFTGKEADPFANTRNWPKLKFTPLTGPGSSGG